MTSSLIKIAWRNVRAHFRHNFATAAAIAFGFAAISIFDGFLKEVEFRNVDGFTRRGMLGDLVIQKKGAAEHMDEDPWKYAMSAAEVSAVQDYLRKHAPQSENVRFLNTAGAISAGDKTAVFVGFGFDVEAGLKIRGEEWAWNAVAGKPIQAGAENQIVVGSGLARILGCELDDQDKVLTPLGNYYANERGLRCPETRVTLSGTTENAQVNAVDAEIVGAIDGGFREVNKRIVHMPFPLAQKFNDTSKVMTQTAWINVSKKEAKLFAEEMQREFASRDLVVTYWNDHKLAAFVRSVQGILGVFRNLFMSIVFVISIMSVANTAHKSVNERIREIGMLRSFGFSRGEVMTLFGYEGLFIALFSCAAGLLFTLLIATVLNALGLSYQAGLLSMPVPLRVLPAPVVWLVTGLSLGLLSLLTSVLAARRACFQKVADCLRHA